MPTFTEPFSSSSIANAIDRVADAIRALGFGDDHQPGSATAIAKGLNDIVGGLRDVASAIRESKPDR